MDKEHVKGAADKVKGAVKEAAGKVTGDKELETEGKIDEGAKGAATRCNRRRQGCRQACRQRLTRGTVAQAAELSVYCNVPPRLQFSQDWSRPSSGGSSISGATQCPPETGISAPVTA